MYNEQHNRGSSTQIHRYLEEGLNNFPIYA